IEIIEITSVIALFGFLNRWNDVMATPIEEQALQSATQLIQNWDKGKH
ncbi:MAG: carboxymuconolactone decarboxylase family protein, partial [Proteobacteria bacterium]|nr:carboxymuconolactone decarboxylase family protein [Pseudomonadota bacterium]